MYLLVMVLKPSDGVIQGRNEKSSKHLVRLVTFSYLFFIFFLAYFFSWVGLPLAVMLVGVTTVSTFFSNPTGIGNRTHPINSICGRCLSAMSVNNV